MTFALRSSKKDPVKTWSNENGTLRITKKANTGYILKRISLFNLMGEVIGEFGTLEEAMNF